MNWLCRFTPTFTAESVVKIDLRDVLSRGFSTLLLDLDNTLLPWKGSDVPQSVRDWISEAKRLGMKLCIVSNTHNPSRLEKISEELGIPALARALKPRGHGFAKAAKMLDVTAKDVLVIGDQLLTDVLGGNLAGMHTVLVRPMHRAEFVGTKISRLIERGIMSLMRRHSNCGTKLEPIQSENKDT